MRPRFTFTVEQTARGILTTLGRGDWSLAVARLREVDPTRRAAVTRLIEAALSPPELQTWRLYYPPAPE